MTKKCSDCGVPMSQGRLYAGRDYNVTFNDGTKSHAHQPEIIAWSCPKCGSVKLNLSED